MAFKPGHKFSVGGRKDKPFRDALMMEIKAAGEEHKALRLVARGLMKKAQEGDVAAAREVADRTDGKVPQEAKIELGPLDNMSEDELRDTLTAIDTFLSATSEDGSRESAETETRH